MIRLDLNEERHFFQAVLLACGHEAGVKVLVLIDKLGVGGNILRLFLVCR